MYHWFQSFQVVYGFILRCLVNLASLPNKTQIHDKEANFLVELQYIHLLAYDHLIASIAKYRVATNKHSCMVEFDKEDFMWVVLTKDQIFGL